METAPLPPQIVYLMLPIRSNWHENLVPPAIRRILSIKTILDKSG